VVLIEEEKLLPEEDTDDLNASNIAILSSSFLEESKE
jgi:hypothetical protein